MNDRPYGIAALDRPRRLPRAGRIRLGEKDISKAGKEYPRELDYFNLADAPAVEEFYSRQLGVPPGELRLRELDIIFPVNDARTILDLGYMAYGGSGWKCRGNGVTAFNREISSEIDCAGEDCKMVGEGKCKRQGVLTFVCYLVPGLCAYDIVTSSWRSIENCLAIIETLQDLFERIDAIPLKLFREPYQMSYTDDDGKQHNQTHHCIRLDVAASLLDVKRLQLGEGRPLELEPASDACADDQYPRSVQRDAAALPAGKVIEVPQATDSLAELLAKVPDELRAEITTGFEIAQRSTEEQLELLKRYEGQPDELLGYLSALVEGSLAGNRPTSKLDQKPATATSQVKGGFSY
jgi:hypothetical protein